MKFNPFFELKNRNTSAAWIEEEKGERAKNAREKKLGDI